MSRSAEILSQMRNANAQAIETATADTDARIADRTETTKVTGIIGAATSTGGTDRIPAERRSLAHESTTLTGIPLLDGLALLPDTAGSLTTLPEMVSRAKASQVLNITGLSYTEASLTILLRRVNPSTPHNGGRPRKVTTTQDDVYVATCPSARTNHGSALHAAFRSTDEEIRSFHGNGRQTEMTDYQALRVQVATRRAQRAAQRLASADW